jgi:hypothetical protein
MRTRERTGLRRGPLFFRGLYAALARRYLEVQLVRGAFASAKAERVPSNLIRLAPA